LYPAALSILRAVGRSFSRLFLFNAILSNKGVRPLERRQEAMTVKIIIDRKVKKGKEAEFFDLLKELRSKAISSRGYISGETLRALSDRHNYIVVGTWQSADNWENWERNPERRKVQTRIEKIMVRPTKTKIYVHA
jgi:heme oxygenase (mycobilin-producing)